MSETTPPSAPSPIRPSLRLVIDDAHVEVSVDGIPTADVAELACDALHELLPMDTRRRERIAFAVDDTFSWVLGWRDDLLVVTITDEAGAPWSPPAAVSPASFVDALYRADLGQSTRTLRALDRLRRWIGALDEGDSPPDSTVPIPTICEPAQPQEQQPANAAHHLAAENFGRGGRVGRVDKAGWVDLHLVHVDEPRANVGRHLDAVARRRRRSPLGTTEPSRAFRGPPSLAK